MHYELLKYLTINPEYWEIVLIDVDTPITVGKGSSRVLVDEMEFGRVFAVVAQTDNKKALVELKIDNTIARNTVEGLYKAGLTSFNPATFWLSKYDEVNNDYVALYTPIPYRDYFNHIKLTVYAPQDSSVSVMYSVYRYKMKHE